MAQKDLILKEKVEHEGLFDFKGLYRYAHSWFRDEGYGGVNEEKYSEKIDGNEKEIEIEWKAEKGLSDYFKLEMKLKFKISKMSDVEVQINGDKKEMNKGKVEIEIKGTLIRDPDNKWEVGPMYRFLRDTYNKYIIPGRVDSMNGRVEDDVQGFKEQVKAYLDLTGKK
jgi:hypothetical protein